MHIDLTYALAHSNNYYFATLGQKLGFEKFSNYAHLLGLWRARRPQYSGRAAGPFPGQRSAQRWRWDAHQFRRGDRTGTPLQLAALMSAIANGGTLYYLQYPSSQEEARNFVPRIKRKLDMAA
ncbi:MAG: penicillin-binding transpeptidase domain-containing protein [Ignavibacteriota bacterium]